jgi:hypothetical protein
VPDLYDIEPLLEDFLAPGAVPVREGDSAGPDILMSGGSHDRAIASSCCWAQWRFRPGARARSLVDRYGQLRGAEARYEDGFDAGRSRGEDAPEEVAVAGYDQYGGYLKAGWKEKPAGSSR